MSQLSKYTRETELDHWHEVTAEYIPDTIDFFDEYVIDEFEFLNEKDFLKIKELYNNSSDFIKGVVNSVFEIGTLDLYGGLPRKGEQSILELIKLLTISQNKGVEIPEVDRYKLYHYNDNDGWRKCFFYRYKKKSGTDPQD